MTLGLFVPRSFVSPNGSCGYIPRRRPYSSMVGSGLSRVHRTAVFSGQPLTACPGYAFSPTSGGGISSRAAPFPKNGTGRGVWVELLHYKTEVGPFDTQEELFNALKDYTDAEVEAGTMTQAEATALLEKYQ